MLRYGVFVKNLCSWQDVFDFILFIMLFVGEQLPLEGQKEVVGLWDDFIGEIEISWVVEAGLGSELTLALEELDPLLCTVHAVIF